MLFRDLKRQYLALKGDIDMAMSTAMTDSQYILGPQVGQFEDELKVFTNSRHCISCANGTDALILSLMAWNVGLGDAVFVPDFTCFASVTCILVRGAEPVFVDIDLDTFNMDPDSLEAAIAEVVREGRLRPRVILAVDLFGLPADYRKIREIADRYGLNVLEDGAQGFGGSIGGQMACSFGDISTTSFFPNKPLGCYGDGGAIFTDSEDIANLLRSMRALGRSVEDQYDNINVGLNSRLDTMQAAILIQKLKAFKDFEINRVNIVADKYSQLLKGKVGIPIVPEGFGSSWAQYTILLEDNKTRDGLKAFLGARDIPSMIYYPIPMHQQKAISGQKPPLVSLENSIEASRRVLSLPMHAYMTDDEIETVAGAIAAFIG